MLAGLVCVCVVMVVTVVALNLRKDQASDTRVHTQKNAAGFWVHPPSLIHSKLKTYIFQKSFPPQTPIPINRTDFTDFWLFLFSFAQRFSFYFLISFIF